MTFGRITVFANLIGDLVLSPRGSAGVSDTFHTSAAATALLQQAETAAAAAEAIKRNAAATAWPDASGTPRSLLPHRLPVEVSPLFQ